MNKKQKKMVHDAVEKEYYKQGQDMTRRFFKLFCASLNKEYGFGKGRLMVLIDRVEKMSEEGKNDEVFWTHIDNFLIDQMGIAFDREDYSLMDR